MNRPRPSTRRRGSVYLVVLGTTLIVGMIALTVSTISRLELRAASDQQSIRQARLAARAGLEYATNWMNTHPNWRTRLTHGTVHETIAGDFARTDGREGLGFTWSVTDAGAVDLGDTDLADDPLDHAIIRIVGQSGEAVAALEAIVEPSGRALSCLDSAAHAAGNIVFFGTGDTRRTGPLTSSAAGSGFETSPAPEIPGDHVLDYYVSRGTEIAIGDLPWLSGTRRFTFRLLSRQLNPFGDTNPWGIYWIDCQGESVEIKWSRVLGTLVLRNAGAGTRITDVSIFQPESPNHPSLLVEGNLAIDMRSPLSGQELREAFINNYNPAGMPYVTGIYEPDDYTNAVDSDTNDNRQATLDGVIYVTGTVSITDDTFIRGSLIADWIDVTDGSTLTLEQWPYAANNPPPGFTAGDGVRLLPGSCRWVGR